MSRRERWDFFLFNHETAKAFVDFAILCVQFVAFAFVAWLVFLVIHALAYQGGLGQ